MPQSYTQQQIQQFTAWNLSINPYLDAYVISLAFIFAKITKKGLIYSIQSVKQQAQLTRMRFMKIQIFLIGFL